MLRNPASRAVFRSFTNAGAKPARPTINGALQRPQLTSQLCTLSARSPQRIGVALNRPVITPFLRQASTAQPPHFDKPNTNAEDKIAHQKLEAHPELVSSTSSIHPLNSEIGVPEPEKEVDMLAGMKSDLVPRSAVSLQEAPADMRDSRELSQRRLAFRMYQDRPTCLALPVSCHTLQLLFQRSIAHGRSTTPQRLAPVSSCRSALLSFYFTYLSPCKSDMALLYVTQ